MQRASACDAVPDSMWMSFAKTTCLAGEGVDRPGQRRLGAVHVRATVHRADAVDKAQHGVAKGVTAPLQADVHANAIDRLAKDDWLVQRRVVAVEPLYILLQPTGGMEDLPAILRCG